MPINNNNLVPNHKVIVPAVSLMASTGDIESVLGSLSSGDLATMCTSSNINRWARYKPVTKNKIDTTDELNSNKTWKSSATWWKGTSQNSGISLNYYTDLISMLTAWRGKTDYRWQDFWQYSPPTGGSSSPYRQIDFNYYCHKSFHGEDQDKPIANWELSDNITKYQISPGVYSVGATSTVIRRRSYDDYLLTLADIKVPYGAAGSYLDLGSLYFGVAFVYGSGSNTLYAFQTCNTDFNHYVEPGPDSPDSSSGYDLRTTPLFSSYSLLYTGDYLAFPILSQSKLLDNGIHEGSSISSNPAHLQSRSSFSGLFVPLPFYGKQITVSLQTAYFRVNLALASKSASSYTVNVTVTNISSSSRTLEWSNLVYDRHAYPKKDGATMYDEGLDPPLVNQTFASGTTTLASGATSGIKTIVVNSPKNDYNQGYFENINVHPLSVYDIQPADISIDYDP